MYAVVFGRVRNLSVRHHAANSAAAVRSSFIGSVDWLRKFIQLSGSSIMIWFKTRPVTLRIAFLFDAIVRPVYKCLHFIRRYLEDQNPTIMKYRLPFILFVVVSVWTLCGSKRANAWSLSISKTNVTCSGAGNGAATANVNGSVFVTATASYNWSNGANSKTITGLAPGTYSVTVTTIAGTKIASTTITQPSPLVVSFAATGSCAGVCNGSLNATVSGGTPPYTRAWSNGATGAYLGNLCPGTYWTTVTDANGCKKIAGAVVSTFGVSVNTTPVSCVAGTATAQVSGGPAYLVQWSNWSTGTALTGLATGSYTVTVYGPNGCQATASGTVGTAAPLTLSATATNTMCQSVCNGAIDQTITGGVPPYTYLWSNGATTEDLTGLCGGTYWISVVDFAGCTATQGTAVVPSPMTAAVVITANGCGAASANTTVTGGGTGPFTFQWNTGAQTPAISNLVPGTYTVTVTHTVTGCTSVATNSYSGPVPLVATVAVTNVACAGGMGGATVTATGGTAPYTYLWSNSGTDVSTNVSPGEHDVTVTDANGCTAAVSFVVTVPVPMTVTLSGTDMSCSGSPNGSAALVVTGGFAPYNVVWSNGATGFVVTGLAAGVYCAAVTDANGCTASACIEIDESNDPFRASDSYATSTCSGECEAFIQLVYIGGTAPYTYSWSHGSTSVAPLNLCPGTYVVTATDATGCQLVDSFMVEADICGALAVSAFANNSLCAGGCDGSANLVTESGLQPYSYLWNNGATTASLSGLCAGLYTATVTDAAGSSVTVSIVSTEPEPLEYSTAVVSNACGGCNGSLTSVVSGGTAPYTFQWNNGATTFSQTGLCPGTYFATVWDANGCSHIAGNTIGSGCRNGEEEQPEIQLIPNPTNGTAVLSFNAASDEECTVVLVDVLGRELQRMRGLTQIGPNALSVDLRGYANGLYFLHWQQGENGETLKLIKE